MENKKIKNATLGTFDGIKFKSKSEMEAYKILKEEGLNPKYEQFKIVLQDAFKPNVPYFREIDRVVRLDDAKIRSITYTPDITVEYNNTLYIFEIKGFPNDVYPIKKKLFRQWLEMYGVNSSKACMFFEVKSKMGVRDAIKIIKNERNK